MRKGLAPLRVPDLETVGEDGSETEEGPGRRVGKTDTGPVDSTEGPEGTEVGRSAPRENDGV